MAHELQLKLNVHGQKHISAKGLQQRGITESRVKFHTSMNKIAVQSDFSRNL